MDIHYFHQLITKERQPDKMDLPSLRNLINEYPYFQAGIFAYLKAVYLFDTERFDEELKQFSISVNDRRALFYYILSEEYDRFFEKTGRKDIPEDRTSVLLNAFFESRGDVETDEDLEYNIFNSGLVNTDYFTYLQSSPSHNDEDELHKEKDDTPTLKHQHIIDTFIARSEIEGGIQIRIDRDDATDTEENHTEKAEIENDELDNDIFFTETLSKIYIKQKKYEKAYRIIKHLSLNYPKKNIYFADQLSFLEKLIINSKYKDKK